MRLLDTVRAGLVGVAIAGGGLLVGAAANLARGDAAEPPSAEETWARSAREHSEAAYEQATVRFGGRLGPQARQAARSLSLESAVLVVLRGPDVANCEDLGRQLRELRRAVPEGPGWGMAVLVNPAGEADVRRFLAKERLSSIAILTADPATLLEDGGAVATPAALVANSDGVIRAGVSHPTRIKNLRGRSFAQELPLREPGST